MIHRFLRAQIQRSYPSHLWEEVENIIVTHCVRHSQEPDFFGSKEVNRYFVTNWQRRLLNIAAGDIDKLRQCAEIVYVTGMKDYDALQSFETHEMRMHHLGQSDFYDGYMYYANVTFANTSIDEVARGFTHKAVGWEYDVFASGSGTNITPATEALFLYQVYGNSWTGILYGSPEASLFYGRTPSPDFQPRLRRNWQPALSRRLDARVIVYARSSGYLSYGLYQSGKLLEAYKSGHGEEAIFFSYRYDFSNMNAEEIKGYDIVDQFMWEEDVYDWNLSFENFYGLGIMGRDVWKYIERVDYIRLTD